MKTNNRILPISIESPPTPLAPRMIVTKPKTKKVNAARNIKSPLK